MNPNCSPTIIAELIGIWLMFCMPPATIRSAVPDMIACAPKEIACWLDPHCRSTVTPGTSSGKPAASHDSRAMLPACATDRVDAAGDHVVDGARVDVVAVEQAAPAGRTEVDRMHAGQRSVALADGGAHRVDDVRLDACHGQTPSVAVIPPRTMRRYCRPTCSAVSGPPG